MNISLSVSLSPSFSFPFSLVFHFVFSSFRTDDDVRTYFFSLSHSISFFLRTFSFYQQRLRSLSLDFRNVSFCCPGILFSIWTLVYAAFVFYKYIAIPYLPNTFIDTQGVPIALRVEISQGFFLVQYIFGIVDIATYSEFEKSNFGANGFIFYKKKKIVVFFILYYT